MVIIWRRWQVSGFGFGKVDSYILNIRKTGMSTLQYFIIYFSYLKFSLKKSTLLTFIDTFASSFLECLSCWALIIDPLVKFYQIFSVLAVSRALVITSRQCCCKINLNKVSIKPLCNRTVLWRAFVTNILFWVIYCL